MQHLSDSEILERLKSKGALLILFGGENCGVCDSIRPRLATMLETHFPEMQSVYIDCEKSTGICARYSVFSIPAVKVYIEGKLVAEDARAFSLGDLERRIERPYMIWSAMNDDERKNSDYGDS